MRIGVDVDGVLADFNASYIDLTIATTGRDLFPPRPFVIPTWYYPQHFGYTDVEDSKVWGIIKQDPTFWSSLPAYPSTVSALVRLNANQHDIYFITNRPGKTAKQQTEWWLEMQGWPWGGGPTVIVSADKGAIAMGLELDVYVDDKLENANSVAATPTKSYLLNQGWNQDAPLPNVTRVTSVSDFLDAIGL